MDVQLLVRNAAVDVFNPKLLPPRTNTMSEVE